MCIKMAPSVAIPSVQVAIPRHIGTRTTVVSGLNIEAACQMHLARSREIAATPPAPGGSLRRRTTSSSRRCRCGSERSRPTAPTSACALALSCLVFDSRMRVLLCVSLTVPIIVCVSLHNGVIHRPLQNDGLDIRLCEPRLRARRQRRHEEAVYRHLGLCIRVACNVTHARDAVHFASAARARARARCRLCPAGWPSAAPSAAQRLR